jgi:putative modified peptide
MAGTKFEPNLVDKLLDKLGTDDAFRSGFTKDPKAALQSLGASRDFVCGACMSPKQLASKEQIQQARAKYRSALMGESSQLIFNLET